MVLTVTLNAAVDRTYRIEGFALDRVHRPTESRVVAGGKGVNVARVVCALGGEALATGFLGGYHGRFVERSLNEEGIAHDFVRTRGESRLCIAVVDPVSGTQTEVNENGPTVSRAEVSRLERRFVALLERVRPDWVVLAGSVPPGAPDDIYARLIGLANREKVRSVLDASGAALRNGVAARPWMVKPNRAEMGQLFGAPPRTVDEAAERCSRLIEYGIAVALGTLGREGAVLVCSSGAWYAEPPAVEFVSAVGSGDALVAATLWALGQGQTLTEALRLGVAAGAANAMVCGAGYCTAEQVHSLAPAVAVRGLVAGRRVGVG
ncbi:MAG TPA: 1-phosphofructokinase [Chthonomonadales bacterium]|nr:1-phosphofructokinase [Chthonomonadales bacterium]